MTDTLYLIVILAALLLLVTARQKEVALLLLLHGLLQYLSTLAFWGGYLSPRFAGLLLGFILFTTLMLYWARSLAYSRELLSVEMFFSVAQWAVIAVLGAGIWIQSPYVHTSAGLQAPHPLPGLTLHPVVKLTGNLLTFSFFTQVILHWGRPWSLRRSLIAMGPPLVYLILVALLTYWQRQMENAWIS